MEARWRPSPGPSVSCRRRERMTVFGTVHAPLFHPMIAAKELVTADHVGEGRFGLNLVVGWNEGEFDMFGVTQREHAARYEFAQEWLDAVKRAWSERGEFDFDGQFLKLKGVRANPKPYGGTRPIIMNAGSSDVGQAFALRNCDAFFVATAGSRTSLEGNAKKVTEIKRAAQNVGREIEVYTVGQVICRPSQKEAEDYYRHAIIENADWGAIDGMLANKSITPQTIPPDEYSRSGNTSRPTRSAAIPSSARPTAWRTNSKASARPACGGSRSRLSIISTNCPISALRCCRAWCGSAHAVGCRPAIFPDTIAGFAAIPSAGSRDDGSPSPSSENHHQSAMMTYWPAGRARTTSRDNAHDSVKSFQFARIRSPVRGSAAASRIEGKSEADVDDRHRHCRDAAPRRFPFTVAADARGGGGGGGGGRGGGGFGGHGGGFGGRWRRPHRRLRRSCWGASAAVISAWGRRRSCRGRWWPHRRTGHFGPRGRRGTWARSLGGSRVGAVGSGARPPIGSRAGVSAARLNGTGSRFAGTPAAPLDWQGRCAAP